MKKLTAKQNVELNKDLLLTLSQKELTFWGRDNGYDSRAGFSSFKKALLTIGVDYDALKQQGSQAKREELLSKVTHELVLFSDAKAKNDRFGITDQYGDAVWFGKFFESDTDYSGEQSSGELSAAKKAVWFASKVAEAVNGVVKLTLYVDAEWLCWANEIDGRGGKAKQLSFQAQKLGVVLDVQHVSGKENPADYFTTCSGFKKWSDNNLLNLAKKVA